MFDVVFARLMGFHGKAARLISRPRVRGSSQPACLYPARYAVAGAIQGAKKKKAFILLMAMQG
jgi:hypothetical protein